MMHATPLLWHFDSHVIPAALSLLPGAMTSPEARAMLLAIALQESELRARRQLPNGPARGFWQFEQGGGVTGVLSHPTTKPIILPIIRALVYEPTPAVCHAAIEHNDTLAACFARLLLWVDPRSMPGRDGAEVGWSIYMRNWRPGKPHPNTWPGNFAAAWTVVEPTGGEL